MITEKLGFVEAMMYWVVLGSVDTLSQAAIPKQLHSDQGSQFESRLMLEVCKWLGIQNSRTTPYHPQCDGMVERFNRTLLSMSATHCKDNPWDWEDHIRKVCFAYNTSVHASTGYAPFYLMYGCQATLPVDVQHCSVT